MNLVLKLRNAPTAKVHTQLITEAVRSGFFRRKYRRSWQNKEYHESRPDVSLRLSREPSPMQKLPRPRDTPNDLPRDIPKGQRQENDYN